MSDYLTEDLQLTVILRNDGPIVFCNDSPTFRTVVINLTPEQGAKIKRKHTHSSGGKSFYEEISGCILEPLKEREK